MFWITLALYAYLLMGRIDAQRRQLDFRSRFDALTGLLNRHGLLMAADTMLDQSSQTPATVLFADLNEFKSVNDQFGHSVGDRVLSEFARIFKESTECRVCGRWGGDEFVVVIPHAEPALIQRVIERIEVRIDTWAQCNGLPMSASLGVAHAPADGTDLMNLLSIADIKLYQQKIRKQGGLQAVPAMRPPTIVRSSDEPQTT
ncbi:MAG: GGDEF domain-containing protein [Thiobacillus sp.]